MKAQMNTITNPNEAQSFLSNGFKEVNGWLNAKVLNALDCCISTMNSVGHFWENSLEIGVHEGKFFIPLERATPDDKYACAIDVFDLQMFNIDKSGLGNLGRFQDNIKNYCRIPERTIIVKGDSFDISSTELNNKKYSLISVDGGHTVQHVIFDMMFASDHLQPGGVIILDDFPNASWLGVLEGITLFFHRQGVRVAPFATGYNKLFITTISYQKIYCGSIREKAPEFGLDVGRITQFCGWPIQALAPRNFMPV